ncbi:hypothetical protein HRG_002984 [Hirsutella rhossiliensis]|uniref:Uncharacterized protein n=1 Tax=Hirsutella rhossiliensis TaxID=111463 RepID=A0A9P8SJ63_9HYPO|nr:uncharacterized protein HRG_02984 [Hirsutella rhossiliensis]KAH0964968.1 hypothetical protein HRG_02984 [Hirsutella rhossiliensis]
MKHYGPGHLRRINSAPVGGFGLYANTGFAVDLVLFPTYFAAIVVPGPLRDLPPRPATAALFSHVGSDLPEELC